LRVDRHNDRIAAPWKNGGGVTREVAAFPAGAGLEDFGWRVSLAEVAAAGPFSRFPGVDRILTLLEGRMALSVGEAAAVVLSPDAAPHPFPGDVPTFGAPLDGPAQDLNVMTRRGVWTAEVNRMAIGAELELAAGEAVLILVALGDLRSLSPGEDLALARLDAILLDPGETARVSAVGAEGASCLIRLRPAGRG
jgi:environmental stress-induced protein Ves